MKIYKKHSDMRITTTLTCDIVAAYELNTAAIGVIKYCGEYEYPKGSPARYAVYVFGKRVWPWK